MYIKDLIELKESWNDKIKNIANKIDPKLIGFLLYEDIFNDRYANNEFKTAYDSEVIPLINQFRTELKYTADAYLLNFINDMALILPCTGYLSSTGFETKEFKFNIPDDYIPCIEIEPVFEAINLIVFDYKSIKPYWRQAEYTLFGNNESVIVVSEATPLEFITNTRNKFNRSYGETNLQRMERAVLLKDTFEYPIHIPAITKFEDIRIPDTYETSVRRHAILKKVMETTGILDEDSVFTSVISKDLNIKLKSNYGREY